MTSCLSNKKATNNPSDSLTNKITPDTINLFDNLRNRKIPIAIYKSDKKIDAQKIIIFSHGYGQNKGCDYIAYSYLNAYLALKGYFPLSLTFPHPAALMNYQFFCKSN